MRKLIILRSLTGRAREYAKLHLRGGEWFDDAREALAALTDRRPEIVIVDAATGADLNLGALAMSKGYGVENRGVP